MKTMKSIRIPFLLLIDLVIIASCSNDEDNITRESKDNLLKIKTSIVDTRAVVTGTSFKPGDQIGLYLVKFDNSEYVDNSFNIKADYSGASVLFWNLESDVVLREDNAVVYAYYPYDKDASMMGDSIDIDITPDVKTGQPDYMYGNPLEVNSSYSTADIHFKHALARVTLSITKGANDVGNGKLTKVSLENASGRVGSNHSGWVDVKYTNISTVGKMNLSNGKIRRQLDSEATIAFSTDYTINEKEAQNVDFLVIPTGSATSTSLANVVLTIDGSLYEIQLRFTSWEAGQQYTYPIVINRESTHIPAKIGDF